MELANLLPVVRADSRADDDVLATLGVSRPARPGLAVFLGELVSEPSRHGIEYVLTSHLAAWPLPPEGLFETAFANLRSGLRVDGQTVEVGAFQLLVIHHPSGAGSSAICLEDLYPNAQGWLGTASILVAIPHPGHLLLAADGEGQRAYLARFLGNVEPEWAVNLDPCWFQVLDDVWTPLALAGRRGPEVAAGGPTTA